MSPENYKNPTPKPERQAPTQATIRALVDAIKTKTEGSEEGDLGIISATLISPNPKAGGLSVSTFKRGTSKENPQAIASIHRSRWFGSKKHGERQNDNYFISEIVGGLAIHNVIVVSSPEDEELGISDFEFDEQLGREVTVEPNWVNEKEAQNLLAIIEQARPEQTL